MSGELSILSHLAFALRLTLGIVFLLSAIPKLRQPLTFARSVAAYDILPTKLSYLFAIVLVPLEASLALSFLTGWIIDIALPLAAVILVAFLIAVGINLRRGRSILCGCFSDANEQISPRTAIRLLLLLFVVLVLIGLGSTGIASLPGLGLASAGINVSTVLYLLQSAFFSVFLVLLTAWILNLPELVFLARHLLSGRFLSGKTTDRGGTEET